jgi:hypothetical protein
MLAGSPLPVSSLLLLITHSPFVRVDSSMSLPEGLFQPSERHRDTQRILDDIKTCTLPNGYARETQYLLNSSLLEWGVVTRKCDDAGVEEEELPASGKPLYYFCRCCGDCITKSTTQITKRVSLFARWNCRTK